MHAVYRKILSLIESGTPFAVATVAEAIGSAPGKHGAKLVMLPDGSWFGTVGGAGLEEKVKAACREALEKKRGGIFPFDLLYYKEGGLDSLCGGTVKIMVEYVSAVPHVLIAGGGHCGLEVAKLCEQLGYFHSVLDDRAEYSSKERFPHAKKLLLASPEEFFEKEDVNGYTHVLLLGYSHKFDTDMLYHLVRRYPGWIGVIASKMKRMEMFRRLKARGIPEEQLQRVVAPVGFEIGAETPPEIAVSILGQIIAHWKGRRTDVLEPAKERQD